MGRLSKRLELRTQAVLNTQLWSLWLSLPLPHSLSLWTIFLCFGTLSSGHSTTPWFRSHFCKWCAEMETRFSALLQVPRKYGGWIGVKWAPWCSLEPGRWSQGQYWLWKQAAICRVGVFTVLPDKNTRNSFRYSAFDTPPNSTLKITLWCLQRDLGFCLWYERLRLPSTWFIYEKLKCNQKFTFPTRLYILWIFSFIHLFNKDLLHGLLKML